MPMNEKTSEDLSFGEWLRQRRHILDLTQQELADQVGCARITLRRIEAGALKPSRELAQILLEKLGIPEAEREIWIRFARGLSPLPEKSTESFTSQPATNLPVSLTSFIGRAKEQQEIINLVDKYPLVTLIGPGGIGKTRLALHAGQELLKNYPDGVWLVELASILDPSLVPRTTAVAIGLRDEPQRPIIDMLSDYLREKQMLIIIDNCEHVLDTCARLVDTLLKNCPGLKILATSRESLGIMGEAMYRVPPLGLPDREQLREKIKDHESVRLFEERAQLVQIGFLVTAENASSIAKICCQLDGIPLAIELAAARVKIFSTEQIAGRLQKSFNFLTTGNRTALPRHQTLHAAIDWSYDLLSPAEQTLFQCLSVFVNGWTLSAAESVCLGVNLKPEAILDLLSQLINKSLVSMEELQAETRYHMLETIRQYANQKLIESGENYSVRDRHLDHYLNVAETAAPHLIRREQLEWLARLDADYGNLRAALEWALNKESLEPALRLCAALGKFWIIRCYWIEGCKWLERALAKSSQNIHSWEKTARIKALYTDAELAYQLDRMDRMEASATASLALCDETTDRRDLAIARLRVGEVFQNQEDNMNACLLLSQSLADFRDLQDLYWEAYTYSTLSYILVQRGEMSRLERAAQNLALARKAGERLHLAEVLFNHAAWAWTSHEIDKAEAYLRESEMLNEQLGYRANKGDYYQAVIAHFNMNYQRAKLLYKKVIDQINLLGERAMKSLVIAHLGILEREQGNYQQAKSYFVEALKMAEEIGIKQVIGFRLALLGEIDSLQGNLESAKLNLQKSLLIATELMDKPYTIGNILLLFSMSCMNLKPQTAIQVLGAVHAYLQKFDEPLDRFFVRDSERVASEGHKILDNLSFASAFAEGQKMSLDEALDLALKTMEEM